ncbi:MAG TPA: hypothetical protein VI142_05335 [Gaiellaceae bacterium]
MKILRSYRWRRRLMWAVPLVLIGPLIYLGVHFSSPGNPGNANGPTVPDYKVPVKARFTKPEQREVHRVLAAFITSAVAREHPARSWNLSAPSLREGVTKRQWSRGNLPVVPYPALHRGLGQWDYVEYSYRDSVGLEVFLFPKPGSGYSAMTADVELVKGHGGRWLVDYWMPKKFHGPPAVAKASKTVRKAAGKRTHAPQTAKAAPPPQPTQGTAARPSRAYWAIPIGIISLIVLAPLALGIVKLRRDRKAVREHEAWQSRRTKDAA